MNQIIATGRIIPNTAQNSRNYAYYPANGDKQSFLHCLLSIQKEGAQKDEKGYYPTFIMPMKAFGPTADQINQYFGENTGIEVFGVLDEDNSYVDENGVEHKGNKYIKANRIVYGFGGKPKDEVVSVATGAPARSMTPTKQNRGKLQPNTVSAPF